MLTAILAGFAGALVAPAIYQWTKGHTGKLLALIPFGLLVYFLSFLGDMPQNGGVIFQTPWVSALNIGLSFYVDGLSLLFGVVISFIGVLVLLYAGSYFGPRSDLGRFYAGILFFMAAMLGLVFADNIFGLFVFWELTGISSYILIGFNHEKEEARKAARQALLITGMGGLALMAGFLLMGQAGGSYALSTLIKKGAVIKEHGFYPAILVLLALGAFTKSAQFPFHFWLPNAMEAPTPVSTYLHSATMVKAGVYLLARVFPVLGDTPLWYGLLVPVGAATMLIGAYLSIRQRDIKKILAYSTVSVLGTLVFLLGTGTHAAIEAAMAYVMIHALYKAALFFVAGIVDHETGTRDIDQLSGLYGKMPVTTAAAVLAGLSMAGLPPLFGFIGKELLYGATLEAPLAASILTGVALTTNMLLVVASGIVCVGPFFGKTPNGKINIHEPPMAMWFGPVLLSGISILIGLLPNRVGIIWVAPAVAAVTQHPMAVNLALMHGFTLQLALSIVTFCLGVAFYHWRKAILGKIPAALFLSAFTPSMAYDRVVSGINAIARFVTHFLQSGYLHLYILTVVGVFILLEGYFLQGNTGPMAPFLWKNIYIHEWILALVMVSATISVVRAKSRLVAIIALGVVGFCVTLFYILYGAPDLAMTQFAIDTITVILIVLVIYRLPRYIQYSTTLERLRDGVPAMLAGGIITVLIFYAMWETKGSGVSAYFSESAYQLAKGRNIVNVILVDFRGLDTLGEATVLVTAAIGVYSLLKLTIRKDNPGKKDGRTGA